MNAFTDLNQLGRLPDRLRNDLEIGIGVEGKISANGNFSLQIEMIGTCNCHQLTAAGANAEG